MNSMPRLHLDTDALILGLAPGHVLRERLRQWGEQGARFAVSALAWSEFVCGPVSITAVQAWERLLKGAIVPLDARISARAALLFNLTGRRAHSLPHCIVAATAMHVDALLLTLKPEDYERFLPHGLALAWETGA